MKTKTTTKPPGRPAGKTHPEAFTMRLPAGTLARWRKAAKREGTTVAELVRQGTQDRITRTRTKRKTGR
jgi:hypothetical protein